MHRGIQMKKPDNKEKVCLALHIWMNSHKRFVKRCNNKDGTCRERGPSVGLNNTALFRD